MKILVVDDTTESQAFLAKRVRSFSADELEALDVTVSLAGIKEYEDKIREFDVLILGPGLAYAAGGISRIAKSKAPNIEILMFVTDEEYNASSLRSIHWVRARKVIPLSAPSMDLLQELARIHEEFRASGKIQDCKLVSVTQGKGSVGATSICAALGEICSTHGKKVVLWDLDIESNDLCRALSVNGRRANMISRWLRGTHPITRETVSQALVPISPNASILMTPSDIQEAIQLVDQAVGAHLVKRIIDLLRHTHDCIIVDTSGRLSLTTSTLLQESEKILLVIDDSLLGMSAIPSYCEAVSSITGSDYSLNFLCSGTSLTIEKIAAQIGQSNRAKEAQWQLPAIPFDAGTQRWPGTGKTLYSLGTRATRKALIQVCLELGLLDSESVKNKKFALFGKPKDDDEGKQTSLLNSVLGSASNY